MPWLECGNQEYFRVRMAFYVLFKFTKYTLLSLKVSETISGEEGLPDHAKACGGTQRLYILFAS